MKNDGRQDNVREVTCSPMGATEDKTGNTQARKSDKKTQHWNME